LPMKDNIFERQKQANLLIISS